MADKFKSIINKQAVSRQHSRADYRHKRENVVICTECLEFEVFDRDHLAPQRLGGSDSLSNCCLLCRRRCHPKKTNYYESSMGTYFRLPSRKVLEKKKWMHDFEGKRIYCKWEDPSQPFPFSGLGWPLEKEYVNFVRRNAFTRDGVFRWFRFSDQEVIQSYFQVPMHIQPVPIKSITDLRELDLTFKPLFESLELCYYLMGRLHNIGIWNETSVLTQSFDWMLECADDVGAYRSTGTIKNHFVYCVLAKQAGSTLRKCLNTLLENATEHERFLKLMMIKTQERFPCFPDVALLESFPDEKIDSEFLVDTIIKSRVRRYRADLNLPKECWRDFLSSHVSSQSRKDHDIISNIRTHESALTSNFSFSSEPIPEFFQDLREMEVITSRFFYGLDFLHVFNSITSLNDFLRIAQGMASDLDSEYILGLQTRAIFCEKLRQQQPPPNIYTPANSPLREPQRSPMSSPDRSATSDHQAIEMLTSPKEKLDMERKDLKRRRDEVEREARELDYKMEINSLGIEYQLKKEQIDRAYATLESDGKHADQERIDAAALVNECSQGTTLPLIEDVVHVD